MGYPLIDEPIRMIFWIACPALEDSKVILLAKKAIFTMSFRRRRAEN